jgi:Fur family ferric uptake transcriptional regulator
VDEPILADMVEQLRILQEHLERSGRRLTRQRVAIVKAFLESAGHITTEDLYNKLVASGHRVGLATVYRTLALLCQAELAVERHFGDSSVRYEPSYGRRNHDHMTCVRCNKIVEFENPFIKRLQQEVLVRHGFLSHSHRIQLIGMCRECRESKSPD